MRVKRLIVILLCGIMASVTMNNCMARRAPKIFENRMIVQKEAEKIILKIKTDSNPKPYRVYRIIIQDESSESVTLYFYENNKSYIYEDMFIVEIDMTYLEKYSIRDYAYICVILDRGRLEAYIYESGY